jgi:hypothetical protein
MQKFTQEQIDIIKMFVDEDKLDDFIHDFALKTNSYGELTLPSGKIVCIPNQITNALETGDALRELLHSLENKYRSNKNEK